MYIVLDNFKKQNIIIGNKTKNSIMYNSNYYNLIYSDELCTLNTIIFYFYCDNYININDHKLFFSLNKNQEIIKKIKNIEFNILNCFSSDKIPIYNIYNSIVNNLIKLENNSKKINNLYLKISGIWENEIYYGLIYKFFT